MGLTNNQRSVLFGLLMVLMVSFTVAALSITKWAYSRSKSSDIPRVVTVSESAMVKLPPDTAAVTIGVVNKEKSAGNASKANAKKTSSVIEAIVKAGISKSDVTTSDFSVQPDVKYDDDGPETIVGYTATNSVRVRTKELDKLGDLLDSAIAAGANNVQGIRFDVEDKRELKQKALKLAIEKARGKALSMAEAVGAKLGPATSVSESVDMYSYESRNAVVNVLPRAPGAPSTPIEPGETTVSAQVKVVYALR